MASTPKRLGAITASGTIGTAQTLYTASATADTSTVTSTILVCNRGSTNRTYRLCVSTTTSFEDAGYIVYEDAVVANDSKFLTIGVTLDPSARYLLCSASSSEVSFSVFGVENS